MLAHSLNPAAAARQTCDLTYIARALGCELFGDKRLVSYVTLLIAERDFPKPLPCQRKNRLTDAVTASSRWQRAAVDAWLDGLLPPAVALALDAAAHATAAADMDAAAGQLGGLRLVEGGRP